MSFLGLLQQNTTNGETRNVWSHSSGGWKSGTKALAGPFLPRVSGRTWPASGCLPAVFGVPCLCRRITEVSAFTLVTHMQSVLVSSSCCNKNATDWVA